MTVLILMTDLQQVEARYRSVEFLLPLLTEGVRAWFEKVPEHLMDWDEHRLEPYVTDTVRLMRIRLWEVFDDTIRMNKDQIKAVLIYDGICSKPIFYAALADPHRAAYMLRAPIDYRTRLKDLHTRGLGRLQEILAAPLVSSRGTFDPKTAAVILEAIKFLDIRTHGNPVQRIESKSVNVNIEKQEPELPKSLEELEARIAELRKELASQNQRMIDVTPKEGS